MANVNVLIYSISVVSFCMGQDAPYVKTSQGTLNGKFWKSQDGIRFSGFTGIPFAEPPIGALRFKPPAVGRPWEGTLDASQIHNACLQAEIFSKNGSVTGAEDCLYLNVYTHEVEPRDKILLPVLFYIHGGSYLIGSARPDWLGPEILLNENIVLVTTNYRLGALGFLSTGNEVLPGNNGLKDQALALEWVINNIEHFGGDSTKITVCGNSAGGASAHFHMLSPLTNGLIKGVIAQSGTALNPFAISGSTEAAKNAVKLGNLMNCSTSSSPELIDCLRRGNAATIVEMQRNLEGWDGDTTISPFRPVIEPEGDGAFLTENPLDIIKSGKASDIPLIMGIVSQEGAYKSAGLNSKNKYLEIFDRYFDMIATMDFRIAADKTNALRSLRKFYFGDQVIDNSTKREITDLYTDGWFLWGTDQSVRLHAAISTKPVFLYLFDYRGSISYSSLFGDPFYDYGVCHTDDLLYLLTRNTTFPEYTPTDADRNMSKVMTSLWAEFARNGIPDSIFCTRWEPVRSENLEYYHIKNHTDLSMKTDLYLNRTQFWRSLPVEVIRSEL